MVAIGLYIICLAIPTSSIQVLYVKQGDATLVTSYDKAMMIDCGPSYIRLGQLSDHLCVND